MVYLLSRLPATTKCEVVGLPANSAYRTDNDSMAGFMHVRFVAGIAPNANVRFYPRQSAFGG